MACPPFQNPGDDRWWAQHKRAFAHPTLQSINVIASQRVGAKRRPMTGSAKQSSFLEIRWMRESWITSFARAPLRKRFAFVAGNDAVRALIQTSNSRYAAPKYDFAISRRVSPIHRASRHHFGQRPRCKVMGFARAQLILRAGLGHRAARGSIEVKSIKGGCPVKKPRPRIAPGPFLSIRRRRSHTEPQVGTPGAFPRLGLQATAIR